MNKREYMSSLLELCTDSQKDVFNRMYPNGPDNKQLDWAIKQISNTLKSENEEISTLKQKVKMLDEEVTTLKQENGSLSSKLKTSLKEAEKLENQLEEKYNTMTPNEKESKEIQDKLDLLEALQAAGVDNWNGYDCAIDILNGDF